MLSFTVQPSEDRTLSKRCVTVSPAISERVPSNPDSDEPFRYTQNPEAVQKLNVGVPALLSTLSRSSEHPFFLVYISTDYVFDGHAPADGYEPDAATNPTNAYGVSKLEGEHAVLAGLKEGAKGCVLRVPVL